MKIRESLRLILSGHDEIFSPNGICETHLETDIDAIPDKPLLIISGDNASGKSFMCKVLKTFISQNDDDDLGKVTCMDMSMGRRTAPDISRSFIYGDEGIQSTGETSLKCIIGAVTNSQKYETRHVIMFDEPDIGLSEAFLPALGEYLAQYYEYLPENAEGMILVTHSRRLVKNLMCFNPVTIRMGSNQSTKDWLENGSPTKTVDDLLSLTKVSHKRYGDIHKYLDKLKKS